MIAGGQEVMVSAATWPLGGSMLWQIMLIRLHFLYVQNFMLSLCEECIIDQQQNIFKYFWFLVVSKFLNVCLVNFELSLLYLSAKIQYLNRNIRNWCFDIILLTIFFSLHKTRRQSKPFWIQNMAVKSHKHNFQIYKLSQHCQHFYSHLDATALNFLPNNLHVLVSFQTWIKLIK